MSNISDHVFMKYFSLLVGALALLTVVLAILARVVGSQVPREDVAQLKGQTVQAQSVAERIRPVGQLRVAGTKVVETLVSTANAAGDGKGTYDKACSVCHAAGIAGAPKFGDKAAWKDRIAQGKETLYEHAIKGFTGKGGMMMPPKGGNAALSDADVKAAVDYMISTAQ
ncbi:MAG: c-type cytochrome [Acidiferrobacterales bacterium]